MFFGVHLPGFMGHARAGQVNPLAPSRGGGIQVAFQEPTLERAFGRNLPIGHPLEEMNADQTHPPGRVLAAQAQGGLDRVGGFGLSDCGLMIMGCDARNATTAKPRRETTDGTARQPE